MLVINFGYYDMQWYEKLEKNGFVQLEEFLPRQQANQLYKAITSQSHFKKWNLLTTPYWPLSKVKDKISSKVIDDNRHQQATAAYSRKQFSFSFYRSSNKHAKQHGQRNLHQQVGQKILTMLHAHTDIKGQLQDSFFAEFKQGQFISYHTDGGAGKYAFIYQLSRGWRHCYGGHLELYPRKIKFFKKALLPQYNSLVILKLGHPMPHAVRMLNNPAYKRRITISGWVK